MTTRCEVCTYEPAQAGERLCAECLRSKRARANWVESPSWRSKGRPEVDSDAERALFERNGLEPPAVAMPLPGTVKPRGGGLNLITPLTDEEREYIESGGSA